MLISWCFCSVFTLRQIDILSSLGMQIYETCTSTSITDYNGSVRVWIYFENKNNFSFISRLKEKSNPLTWKGNRTFQVELIFIHFFTHVFVTSTWKYKHIRGGNNDGSREVIIIFFFYITVFTAYKLKRNVKTNECI